MQSLLGLGLQCSERTRYSPIEDPLNCIVCTSWKLTIDSHSIMADSGQNVSTTMLQDIPLEVLDYILMKSVVKTVRGGNLVKCIWKREASRLIKRLRTVWSKWNHRLTTNWFRIVLERTLDSLDPVPIYVNISGGRSVKDVVLGITTMKNEIFILSRKHDYYDESHIISVYDRNDVVFTPLKNVIPLDIGKLLRSVVACDVSSCLYVLQMKDTCTPNVCHLIYKITKDGEKYGQPTVWKFGKEPEADIIVSVDGSLVLATVFDRNGRIEVYESDGSLRYYIPLQVTVAVMYRRPFQKSNGNFVLYACFGTWSPEGILVEVDKNGKIVHEFVLDERLRCTQHVVDVHDRLIVSNREDRLHILRIFSAEYNQLEFPVLDRWGHCGTVTGMHYNRERDEFLFVDNKTLTIVSFATDNSV